MEHIIIYPDYIDALKYAIETHSRCIAGMGEMNGKKFAKRIRESYDQANPMNANAAELAEANIKKIEVLESGTVRWQFNS